MPCWAAASGCCSPPAAIVSQSTPCCWLPRSMPDRASACSIWAPELAHLARRNAELNGMAERVTTIIHDLAQPLPDLGRFDHVATNPPYMAAAVADPSPDRSKALATVESSADLAHWLAVAVQAAQHAGTLLLIHRSDRLDEAVARLGQLGWGDVTIKHLPPASRVLVRARRSAAPRRRTAAP